jgi:hypothetical protein
MATNERDERKAGFIQSATTEPDNGDPPTPTIRPGQSKQPKTPPTIHQVSSDSDRVGKRPPGNATTECAPR